MEICARGLPRYTPAERELIHGGDAIGIPRDYDDVFGVAATDRELFEGDAATVAPGRCQESQRRISEECRNGGRYLPGRTDMISGKPRVLILELEVHRVGLGWGYDQESPNAV